MNPHQDSLDIVIASLRNLKPGARYIYFVGFLDAERASKTDDYAAKIADVAYQLMTEGRVLLTQRRLSPPFLYKEKVDWNKGIGSGFEYIATGAHPKKARPNITFAQIAGGWKP